MDYTRSTLRNPAAVRKSYIRIPNPIYAAIFKNILPQPRVSSYAPVLPSELETADYK